MEQLLLGRSRELARLMRALDEAREGRGGAILLSGEPGIGKTRLAEELARHARERGQPAVWGRAWEGGGAPPFWPWMQIARGLVKSGAEPSAELSRLLPELATTSGGPTPLYTTSSDRFVLFDAMLRLVCEAASRSPLLLLFDDLHATDAATVQMLAFVVPELRDHRVLVVGTYRDVEARLSPEIGDVLALVRRSGVDLRLPRLDRQDVGRIARESVPLDDAELDELYATTEGNPLFVTETVRALEIEGGPGGRGPLPLADGVRSAIRTHLARLPGELRHTLDVAAVIGREFTATALAPLLESSVAETVARLSHAADAGFLVERMPSRFAFAHGLFREVLVADLGLRAAKLHAATAALLETSHAGDPTALAEIARHWLDAGPENAARARDAARRAAEAAAATLAYAEAALLLEQALSAHMVAAPGDARGRAELLLAIGDAKIRGGETRGGKEACEHAAEIARRLEDTDLLVRAALGHGSDFVAGARDRELASLLQEALAVAGARTDLRARLLARLGAALQPARDPREPIRLARDALALLEAVHDDATRLSVLHNASGAMVDFVDPREREPIDEEVARLASAAGERTVHLRALARLYHDHAERGDLSGAAARLDAYESAAQKWRQPQVKLPSLLGRSCLALLRGDDERSARLLDEARQIALRTRDAWLGLAIAMHETASLRIRGSDELLARAGAFRSAIDVFPDYAAGFDAMIASRRGDSAGIRGALGQLDREHVRICMDTVLPTWVAEAAAFIGDAEWGALVEEALAQHPGEWVSWSGIAFIVESPVARGRAFAALARGDTAKAVSFFDEAIAEAKSVGAARVVERLAAEAATVARRGAPVAAAAESAISLAAEGDHWAVTGFGATVHIKDSRGMQMLVRLVAEPRREHHVLDLSSLGQTPASSRGEVVDLGDAGEVIDEQARVAYRRRLADLAEERDEAEAHNDSGRLERVRAEIEALEAEISRSVGIGGRGRRVGAAAERARVNVQRRLAEAIRRIEEAHPMLGRHLREAVRTGAFCSYAPDRASR